METQTSSLQPATFAQPEAYYSSISARCVCQATITLNINNEWTHPTPSGRSVWCRNGH